MRKFKYSGYESHVSYSASKTITNSKSNKRDFKKFLASLAVTASLTYGVPRAYSANIVVDSLADDGSGGCTLREAIDNANDNAQTNTDCTAGDGDDTINMSSLSGTITLTSNLPKIYDRGSLTNITTVIGNYSNLKIDGDGSYRVFDAEYTPVIFRNLYITNGSSVIGEGCMHLGYSQFTIENSTITGCRATQQAGGGLSFFVHEDTHSLTINNSTISNNYAIKYGGGIYLHMGGSNNAVVTIQDSNITGNTTGSGHNSSSDFAGGGIGIWGYTGVLHLINSNVTGNSANDEGGGIYSYLTDLNITNSNISDNNASEGGGIYLEGYNNGGGVNGYNTKLYITNSTISDNNATQSNGGGIYIHYGAVTNIISSTISGNMATSNDGGGIYLDYGDLNITSSTVSGNIAIDNGGGIYIDSDGGKITISDTNITNNIAGDKGGGLYFGETYDSVTLENVNITHNRANGDDNDGDGGGIYTDEDIIIKNSNISYNYANDDGGGIWFDADKSEVNNTTISNNLASDVGGGIYIDNKQKVNISNSTISDNNSSASGGGIYIDDNNYKSSNYGLTITDSTISGNIASKSGGGIYSKDTNDIDINNSIISGNTAKGCGGGVFLYKYSNLTTNGVQIIDNNATGDVNCPALFYDKSNYDKGHGGAIALAYDSKIDINRTHISRNDAKYFGSAIYAGGYNNGASKYFSTINISESNISSNEEAKGAIILGGGGTSTSSVIDTTISNNKDTAIATILVNSSLNIKNSTISGNAGTSAININASSKTINIINSTIASNDNKGLYVYDGTTNVYNSIFADNGSIDFECYTMTARALTNGMWSINESNNIVENESGCTGNSFITTDPSLGTLSNNGGPTFTHSITAGSTAYNAGDNSKATGLSNDQRGDGYSRIKGDSIDIGAFEATVSNITSATLSYVNTLQENTTNDGNITGNLIITLSDDTFTDDANSSSNVSVSNLPAGLSANFVRDSSTKITMTLTGTATNHTSSNSISNLTITFGDSAFSILTATNVTNSTKPDISLNFYDAIVTGLTANVWQMFSIPKGITVDTSTLSSQLATSTSIWAYRNDDFVESPTDANAQEGLWIKPNSTTLKLIGSSETSYDYANKSAQMDGWQCDENLDANKWHLVSVQHDMGWSDFTKNNITPDSGCVYSIAFNYDHINDSWNSTDSINANSALWLQHICTTTPSCTNGR